MNGEPDSRTARVGLALVLAAAAGTVDAIAFNELQNLFVSFMSGNSTRLGVELAGVRWARAAPIGGTIALFVAGAFAGTLLLEGTGRWGAAAVVGTEALIAGAAAAVVAWTGVMTPLYAIAFAMGMQNAAHPTVAGAGIGKSFVTGTLFGVGQALAKGLRDREALLASLANLLSWVAFVAGAIGGTALLARIGTAPTLGTIAGCLALLALLLCLGALRPTGRPAGMTGLRGTTI